jgi:hypothetical protein
LTRPDASYLGNCLALAASVADAHYQIISLYQRFVLVSFRAIADALHCHTRVLLKHAWGRVSKENYIVARLDLRSLDGGDLQLVAACGTPEVHGSPIHSRMAGGAAPRALSPPLHASSEPLERNDDISSRRCVLL